MLLANEASFYKKFVELKEESGSHSPSIYRLLKSFPEISIKIDACFLCNPYAFKLFYSEFCKTDLRSYVQFYPPQNHEVAENIAAFRGLPAKRVLIGNGAIELIEKIVAGKRAVFPLPTFSTYYEQLEGACYMHPYLLTAENGFALDVDEYIEHIQKVDPDLVILVNPNNPTGTLTRREEVMQIHHALRPDQTLLVDESFIDFATEDHSVESYALAHTNIIIIRSLSKDFGIAGLRLGYALLPENEVQRHCREGFLWNSNGIAYYFTELLADPLFQKRYQRVRREYNLARDEFYQSLLQLGIDVVPSQANFFMIRTPEDPAICFSQLLCRYGIYTRILTDKRGLPGNWIRIASKDRNENRKMLHAIKKVWNK